MRYESLARPLVECGHRVVWWSADFSHRDKTRRSLPAGDPGALCVRLVTVPPYRRNVGLGRVFSHHRYAARFQHEAITAVERGDAPVPDLLLMSLPPMDTINAAAAIRAKTGCRLVVDVQDAWPQTLRDMAFPAALRSTLGNLALAPYWRLLKRAMREVDAVCASTTTFADFARDNGFTGTTKVVYLGAEAARFEVAAAQRPPDGPLRLIYLGSMGRMYDLDTVVAALALLAPSPQQLQITFVGDGPKRAALEASILERGLCGVARFTGFLSGEALGAELADAHAGIIAMWPQSHVACPNKACDYAAAGLAILNCLPGEMASLISRYNAGIAYTAGDAESLAGALRRYSGERALVLAHGQGARRLAADNFDRAATYPKWAAWLESLVNDAN